MKKVIAVPLAGLIVLLLAGCGPRLGELEERVAFKEECEKAGGVYYEEKNFDLWSYDCDLEGQDH